MSKLKELSNRLGKLTPEVMRNKALSLVKDHEKEATNLNTDQLFQGEDSEGKSLPEYSDRSVTVFGKPSGPWRLFDSGDFYRGFFVRVEDRKVIFDSRDSKTGMILQALDFKGHDEPTDIFGLQKQNLTDLVKSHVLPDLQKFVGDTIKG